MTHSNSGPSARKPKQFKLSIHKASRQRHLFVESLVNMVRKLGISALAEGIENEEDGATCKAMGFEYAQGYFYGRPASFDSYLQDD